MNEYFYKKMQEVSIFDKVKNGDKKNIIYEDKYILAFNDVNPQAKTHILVIPKEKFINLIDGQEKSLEVLGGFLKGIALVAKKMNLENYQVIFNNGEKAGQTVFYAHAHILAN